MIILESIKKAYFAQINNDKLVNIGWELIDEYEEYVKTLPDRIKFIQGKPRARTKEESNAARRGITNARIR